MTQRDDLVLEPFTIHSVGPERYDEFPGPVTQLTINGVSTDVKCEMDEVYVLSYAGFRHVFGRDSVPGERFSAGDYDIITH